MYYQCRLTIHDHTVTIDLSESVLVNFSVASHHRVTSFRNIDYTRLLGTIEKNYDILPNVATSMSLEDEAYETILHWQELQMSAHKVSTSQSEGGMILSELN